MGFCCITVASSLSHASGNELFDGINDVFTAKNEHRSSFTCVFTSEDRIKMKVYLLLHLPIDDRTLTILTTHSQPGTSSHSATRDPIARNRDARGEVPEGSRKQC